MWQRIQASLCMLHMCFFRECAGCRINYIDRNEGILWCPTWSLQTFFLQMSPIAVYAQVSEGGLDVGLVPLPRCIFSLSQPQRWGAPFILQFVFFFGGGGGVWGWWCCVYCGDWFGKAEPCLSQLFLHRCLLTTEGVNVASGAQVTPGICPGCWRSAAVKRTQMNQILFTWARWFHSNLMWPPEFGMCVLRSKFRGFERCDKPTWSSFWKFMVCKSAKEAWPAYGKFMVIRSAEVVWS